MHYAGRRPTIAYGRQRGEWSEGTNTRRVRGFRTGQIKRETWKERVKRRRSRERGGTGRRDVVVDAVPEERAVENSTEKRR